MNLRVPIYMDDGGEKYCPKRKGTLMNRLLVQPNGLRERLLRNLISNLSISEGERSPNQMM